MKMTRIVRAVMVFLACGVVALSAQQSALSEAQKAAIHKKSVRMSATEKQMVDGWSDGKKLAEFFCSPAALAEFRKTLKGADRVFLGPDEEGVKKFVLEGNGKLSGRGTVRTPGKWMEYAFECELDPDKATVKAFTYKLESQ